MPNDANELNQWLLHHIPRRFPGSRGYRQNVGLATPPHARRPVMFGVQGMADIGGWVAPSGRRLEIETKTTDKQSIHQQAWQASVEKGGGIYILARHRAGVSVDVAGEECLGELGRRISGV